MRKQDREAQTSAFIILMTIRDVLNESQKFNKNVIIFLPAAIEVNVLYSRKKPLKF